MIQLLVHIFLGLTISYVVAIPLGPVNIAVFQTATERGKKDAYLISLGSAIAELFYCLLAMGALTFIFPSTTEQARTIRVMEILAVPILIFLGLQSLITISKPKQRRETNNLISKGSLLVGLTLNLSNVQILALWTGIATYLKTQEWIVSGMDTQWDFLLTMAFIFSVSFGTFLTHATFILLTQLKGFQLTDGRKRRLDIGVGLLFIGIGVYQGIKLLIKYT